MKAINLPNFSNGNFSAIDPLDSRYFDSEVAHYLSEASRIVYQAYIESALAETLADFGVMSRSVANEIQVACAKVTPEEVYREELKTKHDIKALVNCIKSKVSIRAKPYVHFGATSYDIIASANALQMKLCISELVLPRVKSVIDVIIDLTDKYADTPQVGRTHGQHALPITFGFAMAEYVERLGSSYQTIQDLNGNIHGKFSGAVGAHNSIKLFVDDPIKFESQLLGKVGLSPAPYSTQIVPPDSTIRLIDELAIISGVMANLSNDMRHLQRSEINEVSEKFEPRQVGSSTMAQKRNPINFENVVSLSKQVTAQMINANLNVSSDHQRDLTDSASSRFYALVPALVCNMAKRLASSLAVLEVNPVAMKKNLELSAGGIAAEPLYLLFEKYGHPQAHELAKKIAHNAAAKNITLIKAVEANVAAKAYLDKFTTSERAIIISPQTNYLGLAAKKARSISIRWKRTLQKINKS